MFIKKHQSKYLLLGAIATILSSVIFPKSATADNVSPLCENRDMMTEMAISTPDFYAAFCSIGYYDDGENRCYIPTDYYYVGQSRRTGETTLLSNAIQSIENDILIWKVGYTNYTYQIAQKGGLESPSWRSLSVFDNGKRVYHYIVNGYFGSLPCL